MAIKINVNPTNSKVIKGKLFITALKATKIQHTNLGSHINYKNRITYPGMGMLVEYTGNYSRSI